MSGKRRSSASRKSTTNWPVAYRWLATGTLAVYTAVGCQKIALGQDAATISASAVRRFDISAGPFEEVIAEYQRTTGIAISLARAEIAGVQSPGVSGMFTTQQALQRIVASTAVTFRFAAADRVVLELAPVTSRVEVQDNAAPSLPQLSAPLRELPQTITVIPKDVMEQQAATSLRDVLRNVPGLTIAAGEGGVPAGDNLTLRGFSARNDLFADGVRDLSPQSHDPFNLEQVEVIKGPSSAYTGRGSTGGIVNLVSRTPGLQPIYGFSVLGGTDGTRRLTTDLNTPVRLLGERTAFRLNTVNHASGVAGRDVVSSGRWGVAPSLAFGLGTPARLTVSYYKLRQDNMPDYGIPWVPATNNVLAAYRDQPAPVPRDTFYGLKPRDREDIGSDMATVRVEHDFSDTAGIRNQFRYARSKRDSITTAPRFASNDSLVINRNGPSWITKDGVFDNQTDVRSRFSTGRLRHSLTSGLALTRESNNRVARTVANSPTASFLNPDPEQPFARTLTISPILGDLDANSQSMYALDTVSFGDRLQAEWRVAFRPLCGLRCYQGQRAARTDRPNGERSSRGALQAIQWRQRLLFIRHIDEPFPGGVFRSACGRDTGARKILHRRDGYQVGRREPETQPHRCGLSCGEEEREDPGRYAR